MFYAKSTNGFYDREINGGNIPSDAVEISAELYAELMRGQAAGKVIGADSAGRPVLIDPPAPSEDELKARCKAQAKKLLLDSDWSQHADVVSVLANKEEFDAYRAALRALFLHPVPHPTWPVEPDAVWAT